MSNLLFEIGTEEIPAGYIEPALSQLREKFSKAAEDLQIPHGTVRVLGTPRRLTLMVHDLGDRQKDIVEEFMGPSIKAGRDEDGNYTKAAQGFARSKGAEVEDLKIVETDKGEYLMLSRERKGVAVNELLPEVLKQLISGLSFPKSMRWGSGTHSFARPIQWLVALNGDGVIDFDYQGLASGKVSRGHRFHFNQEVEIENSATYEKQLEQVQVIVDQTERRKRVLATIKEAVASSESLSSAHVLIDEDLVDTVTNLVEIPCGVCGVFDEKFLQLPDDVLITSMREHQKYFPVGDEKGNLLAGFVAVNNTEVTEKQLTRTGHQRVLRARLEDALFFFETDKQTPLESRVELLEGIIFQAKLGTMHDKTERITKLAKLLAEMEDQDRVEDCRRAALLCKADLLTDMVGEFPSLQGVMGHAYALLEGEKPEVALAIREHYLPKRSGGELPTDGIGAIVGLADRIDTLAGCFGIGQKPTGTADPFGLRRVSLAILHIIKEFNYSFSLREVIHKALALYGGRVDGGSATVDTIMSFVEGRYRNDCIAKGYDADAVIAATSVGFDDVNDCSLRMDALSGIKKDKNFSLLASSFKRIRNIVKDNDSIRVDEKLLTEEAEKTLFHLFVEIRGTIEPLLAARNYRAGLEELMKMKDPLDTFFTEVMVMDKDETVRQNRLNLLTALGDLVMQVGDISKMNE